MTKREVIDKQIDYIMDTFDFKNVHNIMSNIEWKWGYGEHSAVPDEQELRMGARKQLRRLHDNSSITSGGFMSIKDEGVEDGKPWVQIQLFFGLASLNEGEFYEA